MEDKRQPYSEMLKTLIIPLDAPDTITCTSCGQKMHMAKVNPYFTFFIHRPEEQALCAEKNPTGLKLPLVWSNKMMIRHKLEEYYEKVTGKKPETPKFNNQLEVKKDACETPH